MSRNRKHQTAAVRFGPALTALSLCVFLGGSGVGYVWQKDQINVLRARYNQAERRYQQLRGENEQRARVLANLQSHGEIEARIKKIELGLVPAQPDHTVHLPEAVPNAEAGVSGGDHLYAAQHSYPVQRSYPWAQP